MFSSMKLWLVGIASSVVAILLGLLKYKSKQLDVAEEIVAHQKEEIKLNHAEKIVSEEIREEIEVEEDEMDRKFEIQRKALEGLGDKPLANDLIQLLYNRSRKK